MNDTRTGTITSLVRDVLADARELIRDEIALLRTEAREQMGEARGVGMLFGAALVLGLAGVTLVCVAIAAAAADLLSVPTWASYFVLAVLLGFAAYVLFGRGRTELAQMQVLPKTRDSLRENVTWIQSKSGRT